MCGFLESSLSKLGTSMSWLFRNRLQDDPGVRHEYSNRLFDLPDELQSMIYQRSHVDTHRPAEVAGWPVDTRIHGDAAAYWKYEIYPERRPDRMKYASMAAKGAIMAGLGYHFRPTKAETNVRPDTRKAQALESAGTLWVQARDDTKEPGERGRYFHLPYYLARP